MKRQQFDQFDVRRYALFALSGLSLALAIALAVVLGLQRSDGNEHRRRAVPAVGIPRRPAARCRRGVKSRASILCGRWMRHHEPDRSRCWL